jgi:hypothetical protein
MELPEGCWNWVVSLAAILKLCQLSWALLAAVTVSTGPELTAVAEPL